MLVAMGRALFFIAVLAALPSGVCAGEDAYAVKDWSSVRITLEATPCIGTCPVYTVSIAGDGTVAYNGMDCVAAQGARTGHVSEAGLRKLFQMFAAADFLSLADSYRFNEPDGPTLTVTLAFDGKTKSVQDYSGKEAGMPKSVSGIEDAIDRTANTGQWVVGDRPCTGHGIVHDRPGTKYP